MNYYNKKIKNSRLHFQHHHKLYMQTYVDDEYEAAMKSDEDFLIYTPNQPIPYYNGKLCDIIENIFKVKPSELTSKIPEQLIDRILLSVSKSGNYNIAVTDEGAHYFIGYPDCDFMKQLAAILTLWNERCIFPVTFLTMSEMEDNTGCEIERLNLITQDVRDTFKLLSTSSIIEIYKKVKELLILIDARGIMTVFGLRTSPSSQNEVWPKKYKKDRARERIVDPNNISILTVGGRALTKHSFRSSGKFWGVMEGKTEHYKNEAAYAIASKILKECVWFNIHLISSEEMVLECRLDKGYGIRWKIDGTFIGFLESYQAQSP